MMKRLPLLLALILAAVDAAADVTRVDVVKRVQVGNTGYERIVATVHFAVDPKDPRNRVIADLDRAATHAGGKVEFSADLHILRPTSAARSNGVALVEVPNRGRNRILDGFNRGGNAAEAATDADFGDGFLTRRGYTLVAVGWQFDVPRQEGMLRLEAPAAVGVSGVVRTEFTPSDRRPATTVTDLAAYPPVDPDGADSSLTVRDGVFGHAQPVARGRWRLEGNVVTMDGGFEPGRTYELAYRAADPVIAGLGLAAFRDVASWLKHRTDALATVRHAYAFGSSQSGRFLRTFLYHGFNADEKGRLVFDGVMAHIAGASRLSLNERWATPNSLGMFSATAFPFADRAERDPSGTRTEGLLDNDRARQHQPKVFYTNTSVEYWGGGRAAALVHTTPDGPADLAPPDNVRVYFFAGTQHSPAGFPPRLSAGQQRENPVDYWWTLRALIVAMDRWVRQDFAPPASQYPRLGDDTLVRADQIAFPAIPGVASPRAISPARQAAAPAPVASVAGAPLPLLVSRVDADGNEVAGIRLPDVAVPLATYTGWNFRNPAVGAPTELMPLMGSSIPFAKTRAGRDGADPRPSIEDRYRSKEHYLRLVREATERLVKDRYLLADDAPKVVDRAEQQWMAARE